MGSTALTIQHNMQLYYTAASAASGKTTGKPLKLIMFFKWVSNSQEKLYIFCLRILGILKI
jgi:hypothetical protein